MQEFTMDRKDTKKTPVKESCDSDGFDMKFVYKNTSFKVIDNCIQCFF